MRARGFNPKENSPSEEFTQENIFEIAKSNIHASNGYVTSLNIEK